VRNNVTKADVDAMVGRLNELVKKQSSALGDLCGVSLRPSLFLRRSVVLMDWCNSWQTSAPSQRSAKAQWTG
jgi:hypothetical protein